MEYLLIKKLLTAVADAQKLVNGYLDGFPGLKKWREDSRRHAKDHGYVKNYVGRIRHLPKVKKIYSKFGEKMMDWRFRKSLTEQGYSDLEKTQKLKGIKEMM